MKIGWMVLALVGVCRSAAAVDVTAYITTSSPSCPYAAKSIASSILRKAGVVLAWRNPNPRLSGTPPACLHIELDDGTPAERLPGALAISHPYGGCSKRITVFLDRVRSMAGRSDREAALLAYVLVHEITHVIQGVHRHSEAGVMKAHWTASDREAIFEGRLGFVEDDLVLIRRALAAGWGRTPAALIARSESGTAFRQE